FHILPGEAVVETVPDAARASAERMSSPREQYAAVAAPARRSSTAVRIAELAHLHRRTKVLIGLLVLVLAGFGLLQWQSARDAREVARLQARADSLEAE